MPFLLLLQTVKGALTTLSLQSPFGIEWGMVRSGMRSGMAFMVFLWPMTGCHSRVDGLLD
ncbi:MAG: hypothetical protein OXC68_01605 [Aestuariivita sp.]|nr:hypothetical protein [Aestuariivita sp.]